MLIAYFFAQNCKELTKNFSYEPSGAKIFNSICAEIEIIYIFHYPFLVSRAEYFLPIYSFLIMIKQEDPIPKPIN